MTQILDAQMLGAFQKGLWSAVAATPVNTFPFPFLYGRMDAPGIAEIFHAMRNAFPVTTEVDPKAPTDSPEQFRSLIHLPSIPEAPLGAAWRNIFSESFSHSFSQMLLGKLLSFIPQYSRTNVARKIRALMAGDLKSRFSPLSPKEKAALIKGPLEVDWMFTCDRGGYMLEPHTDHPRKMVTFLLYLTAHNAGKILPGTSVYLPLCNKIRAWDSYRVSRSDFAEVVRARHVEGHFVAFVKSDISWHGVEPGTNDKEMRMSINLTIQRPSYLGGI